MMNWKMIGMLWDLVMKEWGRVVEVYTPSIAVPKYEPSPLYVETRYTLIKSPKKLVEQDC